MKTRTWIFEAVSMAVIGAVFVGVLALCAAPAKQRTIHAQQIDKVDPGVVKRKPVYPDPPTVKSVRYYELRNAGAKLPVILLEIKLSDLGRIHVTTFNADGTKSETWTKDAVANNFYVMLFKGTAVHWKEYNLQDIFKTWIRMVHIKAYAPSATSLNSPHTLYELMKRE